MWIVSLIPENIFVIIYYALAGAGITLYIVSKLVTWIPMITQWKLPMELVGVIALAAGAYFMGGYGVQKAWDECNMDDGYFEVGNADWSIETITEEK